MLSFEARACLTHLWLALLGCSASCSPASDGAELPRELRELDPDSPSLDAVGMLGALDNITSASPTLTPICTATLIGPRTVVTSYDCRAALSRTAESDLSAGAPVFGVGPDPAEPVDWAHVVDLADVPDTRRQAPDATAPTLVVLHLEKPLEAVPKAKLGIASAALVGTAFLQVGYAPRAGHATGQRSLAPVQLTEVRERTLEASSAAGSGDNSQSCRATADALLRVDEAGELVLYGVASDVSGAVAGACGSVYASFADWKARAFLEEARAWTDPCASLAARPVCAGEVARRCSAPGQGARRILEQDCAEHGMVCRQDEGGGSCAPQHL